MSPETPENKRPPTGLEETFSEKEVALQNQEEKKADIIPEREVTRAIDEANKDVKEAFPENSPARTRLLADIEKLVDRKNEEVEKTETATKEALKQLFNNTRDELKRYKEQPEVKKAYERAMTIGL